MNKQHKKTNLQKEEKRDHLAVGEEDSSFPGSPKFFRIQLGCPMRPDYTSCFGIYEESPNSLFLL